MTHYINDNLDITRMVAEIVAAYVSNHTMHPEDLPGFISQVQNNLRSLNAKSLTSRTEPAVPIEESIQPDFLYVLKMENV